MSSPLIAQPISAPFPRHPGVLGAGHTLSESSINLVLLSAGFLIHLLAEASLLPIVTALIYYSVGWAALWLPKLGGIWERHIYTRVFSVGFLVAAVSALYRTFAGDTQGDAEYFFEVASGSSADFNLVTIQALYENALPIISFNFMFNISSALGIPSEPYVGIFLNVFIVSLTGVLALKSARVIYGIDPYRFKRLTLLFSACGLFWIFSGILLRDSFALLVVSLLSCAWIYFLTKPSIGHRLYLIVGASLLGVALFGFIRVELVYAPFAMAIAAVTALLVGNKAKGSRLIAYLLTFIGLLFSGWLLATFGEDLQVSLFRGAEMYDKMSLMESDASSLATALIINQPLPIKLFLGSIYLFVFPIPFWSGFQFESVYNLFKSFNVIYFYFLNPLLVLTFCRLWKDKSARSPSMMFLQFLVVGITLAVARTSLETRHHGAFYVPLFLLALAPDLRIRSEWRQYKRLLMLCLSGVALVHMAWIALKLT